MSYDLPWVFLWGLVVDGGEVGQQRRMADRVVESGKSIWSRVW